MGKWENYTEDDPNLDAKILHIKNIKEELHLNDPESPGHSLLAFHLYNVVMKWGLHFLPVRFLYDIDMAICLEIKELNSKLKEAEKTNG